MKARERRVGEDILSYIFDQTKVMRRERRELYNLGVEMLSWEEKDKGYCHLLHSLAFITGMIDVEDMKLLCDAVDREDLSEVEKVGLREFHKNIHEAFSNRPLLLGAAMAVIAEVDEGQHDAEWLAAGLELLKAEFTEIN